MFRKRFRPNLDQFTIQHSIESIFMEFRIQTTRLIEFFFSYISFVCLFRWRNFNFFRIAKWSIWREVCKRETLETTIETIKNKKKNSFRFILVIHSIDSLIDCSLSPNWFYIENKTKQKKETITNKIFYDCNPNSLDG